MIERAASYGQITGTAREAVRLPEGILPDAGGLSVTVSSSLLSGVSLAGRDLEGYAYLCLEQRSSRLLALALAVGEGGPFAFAPADAITPQVALRQALREIASFRCAAGQGYGLWGGGACRVQSPYLAPYLLFALQRIRDLHGEARVEVDETEIAHVIAAIEASLAGAPPPTGSGPVHASEGWRALAVKVLADERRYPKTAAEALLADSQALPIWAVAHLYDAVSAAEPRHPALPALVKRLTDAITPAGRTAHLVEGRDAFDWTWPSDAKTTAIVLDVLARRGGVEPETARALAAWLLQARRADGTWRSTAGERLGAGRAGVVPAGDRARGRLDRCRRGPARLRVARRDHAGRGR